MEITIATERETCPELQLEGGGRRAAAAKKLDFNLLKRILSLSSLAALVAC
jgi:hypothetical protein